MLKEVLEVNNVSTTWMKALRESSDNSTLPSHNLRFERLFPYLMKVLRDMLKIQDLFLPNDESVVWYPKETIAKSPNLWECCMTSGAEMETTRFVDYS